MPANERSFSDSLPDLLYLDTDIAIAYLIDTEPHHDRCRHFIRRIAQDSRITLLTSSLTWLEYTNVVMKAGFRGRLPAGLQQRFQLSRWQERTVRRQYLQSQLAAFEGLFDQFSWYEISLTTAVRVDGLRLVSTFNLRPYDAVHVASARTLECMDFASFDEAFRRVDGLILWNDLIHAGKPIRG
ncbi:MAG: type II toxin-antitoxin system VapC family toxin [Dehalococcoidia bacterium]